MASSSSLKGAASAVINRLAALVWRVRWFFRWVYLITRWIPWPLRLAGWLALYWSLVRALSGAYGPDWLRRLDVALGELVRALPGWIDAAIAGAPGAVWSALVWTPSHLTEILAVLTLIALATATAIVMRDLRRPVVIIEPFSMPEDLVKQGYDGAAFTRRLIAVVEAEAEAAGEHWGKLGSGVAGETPDLDLPAGSLSLGRLTQVLRHALLAAPNMRAILGVQPERVFVGSVATAEAETGSDADKWALHANLRGWPGTEVDAHGASVEALIKAAAPDLIELVEPKRRVASLAPTDAEAAEQVIARARRRLTACPWTPSREEHARIDRLWLILAFYRPEHAVDRRERLETFLAVPARRIWSVDELDDRAIALYGTGDRQSALAACDLAIALKPGEAKLHFARGCIHDKWQAELKAYERAIKIKADYTEAHNNRGSTLHHLERYEDALRAYDRAISIQPDHAEAHNNRGNALGDLGRYEDALMAYDRAIKVKPDFEAAYQNAVLTLFEADKSAQDADLRRERADRAVAYAKTYMQLAQEAKDHWILTQAEDLRAKVNAETKSDGDQADG